MAKKEVISFRKVIKPLKTDVLQERMKDDGTVEEVRVRFYPGQEKSLQVSPFIEHKGNIAEQLLSYPRTSDPFLSGEDDYFIYPVVIPVAYDDFVKIKVKNIDSTYEYTLVVDVVIDYYGGQQRMIGG
jgi:hypothetical protein